jgi:phosphatidylglycerol:prolipoprotein diacylglycerol transferase
MESWYFNPVIFQIGPIQAHFYGLMYALSFIAGYLFLFYSKPGKNIPLSNKQKDTFVFFIILGVILGGRLGYVLFYNLPFYLENPLKIFAVWEGGMSFHGGLLGVTFFILWVSKKYKIKFLKLTDFIVGVVPLGVMFVRIGNFVNAELYGRIADKFCLYFPTDPTNCRYPSQLLQAFLEGLILFIIIQLILHKSKTPGVTSSWFLILYGSFRIIAEFFREPDPQLGFIFGFVTQGQLLSAIMVIAGLVMFFMVKKSQKAF